MHLTSPASPNAPEAPRDPRGGAPRPRRWLRRALVAVAVLGAVVAAAILALPALVRAEIVRQARERGVALEPGSIDLAIGAIRLKGARFTLVDAPGIEGALRAAVIRLDGIRPTRVEAEGMSLSMVGVGTAPALAAWASARHAALGELPLVVRDARTGFRDRAGVPEMGALLIASLETRPQRAGSALDVALRGVRVVAVGREIARTDAALSLDAAGISIALGAAEPSGGAGQRAPVRIALRKPPAPDVAVQLAPTPVDDLAAPLGITLHAPDVSVGGKLELRLPGAGGAGGARAADARDLSRGRGPVEISAAMDLAGYVPPHPRELDGILFGQTTKTRVKGRIEPGWTEVVLSEIEVGAGGLALRGSGAIRPEVGDAHLTLDLAGGIPCSHLTNSAIAAHLGRTVGDFAGKLAQQALEGSVAVRVKVDARLSRLEAARIERSAQVGCRIRSLF